MKKHIVKRKGHLEPYKEEKLRRTVRHACQSTHMEPGDAKEIEEKVAREIAKWIKKKPVVTTDQIFRQTVKVLKKLHADCAFMYEKHRDIS